MQQDAARALEFHRRCLPICRQKGTEQADALGQRPAADPDRRPVAVARLRALPGQADARRPRRGLGRRLPRRPRAARRRRPLPRPRARAAGARCRCATTGNDRWTGAFEVDELGRWEFAVEAWVDRFATWRDELRRKVAGGADRPRERARRGRGAARPRARDRRGGARDRRRATAPRTTRSSAARASTSTRCSPASARGTSSSRARAAASRASRSVLPQLAELGFDVVYLPPIHPIGRTAPQGPQQHAHREGRATRAARGRSAPRRAATTRSTPTSARSTTSTGSSPRARELGIEIALDFAIQCSPDHPWLTRAPRVVPAAARRHDQVRREPAQALPGHRQRRLGHDGLARALGRAARRRPATGSSAASASSASTTRTRSRCRSGSG